jgi:hypothetical protein
MREGPGHCVYRDVSSAATPVSRLFASLLEPSLPADLSVDKLYYLLHRLSRCGCTSIPLNETFGLALEECELYLASRLALVLDEAIDVGAGMSLIACALKTDHWRHFNPLTAFKRSHRASLGHRVLGLPVLIVAG